MVVTYQPQRKCNFHVNREQSNILFLNAIFKSVLLPSHLDARLITIMKSKLCKWRDDLVYGEHAINQRYHLVLTEFEMRCLNWMFVNLW